MMTTLSEQTKVSQYKRQGGRSTTRRGPGLDLKHGFLHFIQKQIISNWKKETAALHVTVTGPVVCAEKRRDAPVTAKASTFQSPPRMGFAMNEEEEESTPCLGCSFRGSRRHNFNSLILPRGARTAWSPSVGRPRRPGRGRAQVLKERNRGSRVPGRQNQQDDALSSSSGDTGSYHSNRGFTLNIAPDPWSEHTKESSSSSVEAYPVGLNINTVAPLLTLEPQTYLSSNQAEEKESNISQTLSPKNGKKKSKKKFVPLDLGLLPVEKSSQLLYGIPAGSEKFGNDYSQFHLAREETYTPEFGYAPQQQPKVNSVLHFPMLPQEKASTCTQVNFMNVPQKTNGMKAIASVVVRDNNDRTKEEEEEDVTDSAGGEDKSIGGATLVLENIPWSISKGTVRDLLETYGTVMSIRMEKIGGTCTMYAKMDVEMAEWAAESLDDSDTLIHNGEEGDPLHVYVMS